MGRLVCLGEIMVELAPAKDGLFQRGFAGDTFNTAWYARRILPPHWQVSYATMLGNDPVSDEMVQFIAKANIHTDLIQRHPDRTAGLYMITLNEGERSFSYWRSQSAARCLADDESWLAHALQAASMAYVSGITLAILSPDRRKALCAALAAARAAGTTIVFDTNLRLNLWGGADQARAGLLAGAGVADVVLPSFDEEQMLFGDETPSDTIARYRSTGARIIAVKNGADPCTIWSPEIQFEHHPPKAEQIDSTAAGDSFGAGMVAGLAQSLPLDQTVKRACALAARVISSPGALVPNATKEMTL